MKLTKSQGISLFAAIVLFGMFNVVVFLAPIAHSAVFWLGYFFALYALVTMMSTLVLYFGKSIKEEKFLSLPAVKFAWTYFVLQIALSVWQVVGFPLSYMPVLIIDSVLGALCTIVILSLYTAAGKIDKAEQFTAEKVIFIKQLKLTLEQIETDDAALAKKIKELAEDVRFSDPMSHSILAHIEGSLLGVVEELSDNVTNKDEAFKLCDKAAALLKKRNEQCKMYKGLKDPAAETKKKSGGGLGMAFAGVTALLAIFLIAMIVCFIIVPQTQYADAIALLETEKYDEAIAAFSELGDYRDSKAKVEEVKTIVLDKAYDAALALLEEEKYEEATAAFAALGGYRDSEAKIEEMKTIPLDKRYGEAEALFDAGNYSEAINIYSELGDYKDSKLRIEQIYNRLSEGDTLFFGTYNGKPIAWKILKTEKNKMMLIAEEPIAQKPFTDDIKKVTWETSFLRTWLNGEFMESFSDDQQNQIVLTDTGSTNDKVFLLSVDEVEELSQSVGFTTEEEWWTRTSSEDGIQYMTADGCVISTGDQVVRDKGVRPAIWIYLG